ncbi:MAG TPA: pseudouridine synthase [Candidatus Merdisoma faecalis]|nr:23S rRNA pseudouridine synthase F [Lachnoclostridium sp. An138]HIR98210.1 pseudouridine synthase [Candidatus Merdisoma faecalis]
MKERNTNVEEIRLNKYLSEAGVCSRREADRLIEAGKVLVDGKPAVMGMRVRPDQEVQVGKKIIGGGPREERVLLAVYKPPGVICTTDQREKRNIVDYVGYPVRIYPIGRLDKDSEGLILMTNDGSLVNRMMRSSNHHEKEYLVTVNKPVTDAFLEQLRKGVRIRKVEKGEVLLDTVTKPCQVEKLGKKSFRIILTQGLNRQIRRMCEALGYQVENLKRVRVLNIELKGMKPGTWRKVTEREMAELLELIRDSRN